MSETSTLTPLRPGEIMTPYPVDLTDQFGIESLMPYLHGFRTQTAREEFGDFDSLDRDEQLRCLARSCIGASQKFAEESLDRLGGFVVSGDESIEFDFHGDKSLYADALFRSGFYDDKLFRPGFVDEICGRIAVDQSLQDHARTVFADHSAKSGREAQLGPIHVRNNRLSVIDPKGVEIVVNSVYEFKRSW